MNFDKANIAALKLAHLLKNSGRLLSAGPDFKLKYEDLENVKVNTVVFNVYQLKHRAFFGKPGIFIGF